MPRHRLLLCCFLVATAIMGHTIPASLVTAAEAQSKEKAPRRPKLPEGQDSNSAIAYYLLGNSVLANQVDKAADAYYWASRLDPAWAAPVYGRYAALLLAMPTGDLSLFMTNRAKAMKYPRLAHLDSLAYAAELKNPFVDRRIDGTILNTWLKRAYGEDVDMRDLGRYDRRFTALAASARGDYPMATTVYREVIAKDPDDINLLFAQGRNFFSQGQYDSARVMVQLAMTIIRNAEAEAPSVGWVPHAFGEYSVGFIQGLNSQLDSSQAAYERALLDDIKFHPAHYQLGRLRLFARDTAGAIAEFTEALTLAPHDAAYMYDLAMLLMAVRQSDSALKVFTRATEEEPYFAPPHYPLGLILEHAGFTDEAMTHYSAFVSLAPRSMSPAIAAVKQRMEKLKPGSAAP